MLSRIYCAKYLLPISTPPIECGGILVRDGRIAMVGHQRELRKIVPDAEIIEFEDGILLPPLVNAHTHLELSDFPAWAEELGETGSPDPDDFVGWIERVIRVKRATSPEQFSSAVAHGITESLRAGTGAIGDIISQFDARLPHQNSPLMGRLYFEAVGRQAESTRKLRKTIAKLLNEGECGRLEPGLAPHAPYSLSAQYLEELLSFARKEGLPCTIHLAESESESAFLHDASGPLAERLYPLVGWGDDIPEGEGLSPVAYLARLGGVTAANTVVHGVQVDEADVLQLASAGTSVVVCPRSNQRLGVGQVPIDLYKQNRVRLALGTDSGASNDSLSVWDEIAFARSSYQVLHPATLLEMATVGGADVLGLVGEIGALQQGWGIHFQVVEGGDLSSPGELFEFLTAPGRTGDLRHLYLDDSDCLPSA